MKNNKWVAMVSALGMLAPLGALAYEVKPVEAGAYVGVGYMQGDYDEQGFEELDVGGLFLRGGYQFNTYLAAELRVGDGDDGDSIRVDDIDVDFEVKNFYGAYFKAGFPTPVGLYPYAVLGVTRAKFDVSASVDDYSASTSGYESSMSYGAGVDFYATPQVSVGLELMKWVDEDEYEVTGLTLSANFKF